MNGQTGVRGRERRSGRRAPTQITEKTVTLVCVNCGKEFMVWQSWAAGKNKTCCSAECRQAMHTRRVVCAGCGKEFVVALSTNRNKIYCSMECRTVVCNRTTVCASCGKEFRHNAYRKAIFCSRACLGLGARKRTGELHHAWAGGRDGKPEQRARKTAVYTEWRGAVYARDDYTCQSCGARGGKLHAHHVVHVSKDPSVMFDVKNGLTMCEPCHVDLHRGPRTGISPVRRRIPARQKAGKQPLKTQE